MDLITWRICGAAIELARSHGVFFAAAFLAERGISIELAVELLAKIHSVQTIVLTYDELLAKINDIVDLGTPPQ